MTHTNDGGPQILPMPRTREHVYSALRAAEAHYWTLLDAAGDFYALDFRPILVNPHAHTVERVGAFELPTALHGAIQDAARSVALLRYELAECSR
jgi:hypothetical protein